MPKGISQFLQTLMLMKRFRQAQEERKFQRGITREQLDLERQRLEQERPPTQAEIRWSMQGKNFSK